MEIKFHYEDYTEIRSWLQSDGISDKVTVSDFIRYFRELAPTMECSVVGEYEHWRDNYLYETGILKETVKMNHLNSLLLEGVVSDHPTRANEEQACFEIESYAYRKVDDEYVKDISYFRVCCFRKMADLVMETLKKGRGVRMVGRIKALGKSDDSKYRTTIIAEHIEFKPKHKQA